MRVINGMSNNKVPNLVPPISSKGSRKSIGNQGKFFLDVAETSNHSQSSANPNPKCQKKKKKTWTKQVCKPAQKTQVNKEENGLICRKRRGVNHLELPLKRRLVSKDDGVATISMVEAVQQPRQSQ